MKKRKIITGNNKWIKQERNFINYNPSTLRYLICFMKQMKRLGFKLNTYNDIDLPF